MAHVSCNMRLWDGPGMGLDKHAKLKGYERHCHKLM